ARIARARSVPVVLSPICWYEPRAMACLEPSLAAKFTSLAGWAVRSIMPGTPSWRLKLLRLADLVLPNSPSEARQLVRLWGLDGRRIRVVPNGVLRAFSCASPERYYCRFGELPFVLSTG